MTKKLILPAFVAFFAVFALIGAQDTHAGWKHNPPPPTPTPTPVPTPTPTPVPTPTPTPVPTPTPTPNPCQWTCPTPTPPPPPPCYPCVPVPSCPPWLSNAYSNAMSTFGGFQPASGSWSFGNAFTS